MVKFLLINVIIIFMHNNCNLIHGLIYLYTLIKYLNNE